MDYQQQTIRLPGTIQVGTTLIAQGSLDVASRFRGLPPADARKNASDFDSHSAYHAPTYLDSA